MFLIIESKKRLLFLFPFVILFSLFGIAQDYGTVIYLSSASVSNTKDISEAVNDMAYWLSQATGKSFDIKKGKIEKGNHIQLELVDQADLQLAIKKRIVADGQSFYLSIDGTNTARIVGSGTNSLINGIYTFLQELGFRWYMPGDAWSIVPKLNKTRIQINKVYTPDFRNRSYFGTGGINTIPDLDPKNTFKKDFDIWNRRNRFSADYAMKGHTGQAFYIANRKVLNEHPEYFCNDKVNPYGRIDISNQNVVNLYIQWALQQVNPQNRFSAIGVEPTDASGGKDDCLPSNMSEIKTWSDKYFWLANKVAQEVNKKEIDAIVNLYAYGSHAAPPNFKVNPRVYPIIIPYAFQNVTEPKQYIELWQKHLNGRPMGVYDYWNITQWSNDLPQFNIYTIPNKLRFWKKNNITTINLESTNAKGPMGHAFWMATQMMWDTNLSFDKLYDEFLNQCFGPAAKDIKNMYDRWSLHYQGAMDVSLSLHDLASASAKTTDASILKRILELKAYVHYLKLYYDYQYNHSAANYKELISYIYSIHHLRLLQTIALVGLYIKPPISLIETIDRKVIATEDEQLEKSFKKDVEENPVTYSPSTFQFDITKAVPTEDNKQKKYNPLYIIATNNYSFYLPKQQHFIMQVGASDSTRLIIKDDKNKVWLNRVIAGSKQGYEPIELDLPKGKYVLTFGAYYRFSRIIFPEEIAFFSSDHYYDNAGYPLLFVYVPKGVKEIIYRDAAGPGANRRGDWINPDGKHVSPALIKNTIYRILVPASQSGKVWTLNIGHRNFELLNIPNLYSLNKFGYKE